MSFAGLIAMPCAAIASAARAFAAFRARSRLVGVLLSIFAFLCALLTLAALGHFLEAIKVIPASGGIR